MSGPKKYSDDEMAKRLMEHLGHPIEIVKYGDPAMNVAIECVQCGAVLMDFDVGEPFECVSCGADLEPGVDVCEECGEPTGTTEEKS